MSMAQCFLFPWSQRLLQTNLECSPLQKYFCILIFFSMFTTFEFEIFVIMLYAIVNIGDQLNISRLHFDCSIRHVAPHPPPPKNRPNITPPPPPCECRQKHEIEVSNITVNKKKKPKWNLKKYNKPNINLNISTQ